MLGSGGRAQGSHQCRLRFPHRALRLFPHHAHHPAGGLAAGSARTCRGSDAGQRLQLCRAPARVRCTQAVIPLLGPERGHALCFCQGSDAQAGGTAKRLFAAGRNFPAGCLASVPRLRPARPGKALYAGRLSGRWLCDCDTFRAGSDRAGNPVDPERCRNPESLGGGTLAAFGFGHPRPDREKHLHPGRRRGGGSAGHCGQAA